MKKEAVYHFCQIRYMSAHIAGSSRDSGVSYAPVSLVLSVAGVIQCTGIDFINYLYAGEILAVFPLEERIIAILWSVG